MYKKWLITWHYWDDNSRFSHEVYTSIEVAEVIKRFDLEGKAVSYNVYEITEQPVSDKWLKEAKRALLKHEKELEAIRNHNNWRP